MNDDASNVVPLTGDPSSPLTLIVRRRRAIRERMDQLKEQSLALENEYRALQNENHGLEQAEVAVRRLLERKP